MIKYISKKYIFIIGILFLLGICIGYFLEPCNVNNSSEDFKNHSIYNSKPEVKIATLLMSAKVSFKNKDYVAALDYLDKALDIDSRNIEGLSLKAKIYLMQQKYEKARDILEKIVELDDKASFAWNNLAHIALVREDYKEALRMIKHAIAIAPDNIIPRLTLLDIYIRTGKNSKALNLFNKIKKDIPAKYLSFIEESIKKLD